MSTSASTSSHHLPWSAWPRGLWRAFLLLWLMFWLLMVFVQVEDSLDNATVRWWQPLCWELSSMLVVSLLGIAILHYGNRQQHLLATPWRWFWQHLQWLPLISALFIAGAYGLRHGIYALAGASYHHSPWLQVYLYETVKLAIYLGLWLGVLFGFRSFIALREQQNRLHAMQQALVEARLQQLKAQLQPHFLFNTLNTISDFMHSDVERADRLLTQLADLLRANLNLGEQHTITLAAELELLRLYSAIMTERFGAQVHIDWQVADDTLNSRIPALLLQPLLENAFKHGVERATAPTRISVSAERRGADLHISISNSVPAEAALVGRDSPGTGTGLRNCRERLRTIYGESANLQLLAHADRFEVNVLLPGAVT